MTGLEPCFKVLIWPHALLRLEDQKKKTKKKMELGKSGRRILNNKSSNKVMNSRLNRIKRKVIY